MTSFQVLSVSVAIALFSRGTAAQPSAPRVQVAGSIAAIDAAANQLTIKSDKGDVVSVSTTDRTLVVRIPPGETDPKQGTRVALSTVAPGDRVVAVGRQSSDPAKLDATSLLIMTKSDVAQVRQREREDWQKRGVAGTVTVIDPAAKTFSISAGQKTLTVQPSDKTDFHRYSPDSARFADARPSAVGEIKAGDWARVLGNRNADGTAIAAEKIVFGSFRQFAGTIESVNSETGDLRIKDLATKKPLTIKVNSDSTLKKLPQPMAAMLARRYRPGGATVAGDPPAGAGDIQTTLDRLPLLPLQDLKQGDAIMVSTTQGSDPTHVTAIMLLAGVEPLLTASPTATRDIMSGWNLSGGGDPSQ
jgi:hypothetical protein